MHKIYFENSEKEICNSIEDKNYSSIVLLCDAKTNGMCSFLAKQKNPILKNSFQINIPCGETYKTLETTDYIYKQLLQIKADKKTLLVNIGGGMISDIGGFVASTYKRGVDFINIPTTLLAMVDASIGGKNALNISSLKNMVGTFYLPQFVYINNCFLQSLPQREIICGISETIKHALISDDPNYWNEITSFKSAENFTTVEAIKKSSAVKMQIIAKDLYENNERQWLNFGHSVGHAIETYYNGEMLHGEAVMLGLIAEAFISENLFQLDEKYLHNLIDLKNTFFPNIKLDTDSNSILKHILNDKKNISSQNIMALLTPQGMKSNCIVSEDLIIEAIQFIRSC